MSTIRKPTRKLPVSKKCVVCGFRKNLLDGRTLHRFPKDLKRSNIWAKSIDKKRVYRLSAESRFKNLRVCSHHFKPEDYAGKERRFLLTTAVPCHSAAAVDGEKIKLKTGSLKIKEDETSSSLSSLFSDVTMIDNDHQELLPAVDEKSKTSKGIKKLKYNNGNTQAQNENLVDALLEMIKEENGISEPELNNVMTQVRSDSTRNCNNDGEKNKHKSGSEIKSPLNIQFFINDKSTSFFKRNHAKVSGAVCDYDGNSNSHNSKNIFSEHQSMPVKNTVSQMHFKNPAIDICKIETYLPEAVSMNQETPNTQEQSTMYGKFIAAKLSQLGLKKQEEAKNLINNILQEAENGAFSSNTVESCKFIPLYTAFKKNSNSF